MSEENNHRVQMYRSILITAIEGGINYWARVLHYNPDMNTDTLPFYFGDECRAVVVEDEDGAESKTIDTATIRKAMSKLSKGGGYRPDGTAPEWWTKKWRKAYKECADGSWDFDASDADTVVQVAIFGEVVYG